METPASLADSAAYRAEGQALLAELITVRGEGQAARAELSARLKELTASWRRKPAWYEDPQVVGKTVRALCFFLVGILAVPSPSGLVLDLFSFFFLVHQL
jgi:hypothetical protein